MILLVRAMHLLKVEPLAVFVQAFDFFEVRMSAEMINETFNACCKDTPEGRVVIMMPRAVMLYCVEVLSGLAVPLGDNQTPLLGESNEV